MEPTNLFSIFTALPSLGDVQVKLAIDSTDFSVYDGTNHLEIDRNSNLRLKCNVIYSGSRNLEYSWLKDGVYLENNTTVRSFLQPLSTIQDDYSGVKNSKGNNSNHGK